MIVDADKLLHSLPVHDVTLVTLGDMLNWDRMDGFRGGLDEFERRYPSHMTRGGEARLSRLPHKQENVGSNPTRATRLGCGKVAVFTHG